ncbi:sensor histidine kinase [Brevibacillus sp. NPDC003359]|uniref:sensor histidine kinase n=1 Tax=unclassified Brevibacillus TaxID=2684853 RepID=UPI0036857322
MKKGIVLKLFLLTSSLCMLILAVIFIGQTLFFKQFYVHQKEGDVKTALQSFQEDYLRNAGDAQTAARLEQEFYQKHNTWIAALDSQGNLKNADDYFMEVRLDLMKGDPDFSGRAIKIPLYKFIRVEEFFSNAFITPWIKEGERIAVEGLKMNNQLVIQRMGRNFANLREENHLENRQMVSKEYEVVTRYPSAFQYREKYPSILATGTITGVRIPEGAGSSRYTNYLFLERIKAFQADLLYGDYDHTGNANQIMDYEENHTNYKIFVNQIEDRNGNPAYIFAMTSLQPVNEAAVVLQNYYLYIIIGTLLLVLMASFYYSRWIARPLLHINRTTQQMAGLDFSEKIPVTTKDEIGDLSRNINELSDRLHSHILQLEQDIEKEKQLEHTRKEFISGVSHELKTPLSVIQSCLSILKDGVASHKKDYYFEAMENEVKKMDMLIVDMLELAKYESGTYKMKMEQFPLDTVITQICEKLRSEMESKQLHLHTDFIPVNVVANQLRIEQVLVNFLTNAIRYTPEHETIIISSIEEKDMVKVCIENKGAHIQEEHLKKIWDRFYRAESSRHRSTGGIGLGLAISKKILEMHDVPYGAYNTEEGVMFYFYLNKEA